MDKPYLIGITGGSGSGKTTFLKKIAASFPSESICIISQDDYYKPKEQQQIDRQGITNFDLPKSIDKKAFRNDIEKLLKGESIQKLEYTFNNKKAKPKVLTFKPAPIIIVEGLFVFHFKKIAQLLDLKVYVHAKENLKVIRRIKRDQSERNYPLEDVLYRYQNHVLPTFERYIKPYIDEADIIINNNKNLEGGLEVFLGFLKSRLNH